MKQFFKFVFATIVGIIILTVLLFIIVIGIAVGLSGDKTIDVPSNSVMRIALTSDIKERTPNNPLAALGFLGFDEHRAIGLNDILANIKKAKTDDHIKGIFLDESYMLAGQATTEEIRNALIDFKRSGKFIIAYGEIYTQSFYYLSSVADKIYMNPKGIFEFHGFSSQIMFYKGAMDKLGIEAQVIKVGTYKSATEPFVLNKMSDANRKQVTEYLGSMYDHFLTGISASRKISKDSLFNIANNMLVRNAEDAVKFRLIDGLRYKDELLDELKGRTGLSKKQNVKSVDIADYTKAASDDKDTTTSNSRIAIVYASGEITGGDGDDNTIGSERISKTLRQVRLDDKVKAVVLRVNSPGGSSLASDVIWREVMLTKKVKPIIVSMGDVAASGGYYISCAADSIYAEPNTITGSIGIFAIIPNMQKFFNEKLGLTFDGVKTGKYADLGNGTRPLSPEEKDILQNMINRGYDDFTKAVANGRGKTQAYINTIAQGRVWTGQQAIKIGLVDKLGNINDAIRSAAAKAKIKDYSLVPYPEQESSFKNIGRNISVEMRTHFTKAELGDNYKYYEQVKQATQMSGILARMPYEVTLN
ncbi:signal peptide peptidase SppA [Mucilaginibacter sp. PPCGB 2223]|uniref:signal peptide peptidase SppA n=1 Tax=Mucilaginibacter sp. PPCGB 2223 TaxID=1886027 RepID=UPI0008259113|nr:signal peptide peptidase SppA [Mucilaginibacter sp. PPCGB 2223]OCX54491.1 signal peptide peptidase SppA [Mucilaginibacter sp. PPCGB 2223]